MADHTAPDYYEQVTREANEKIARDDAKIATDVDEVAEAGFQEIHEALVHEFGWNAMRNADMGHIKALVSGIARQAAREAQHVMIESHYQDSRKSTGTLIEAVFAGMELERGKDS